AGPAAAGDETRAAAGVAQALALGRARAGEVLGPRELLELESSWSPIVEDAARALSALSSARTVMPAPLDLLLSVGERLSSQLVASALRARGLPGLAVDAREVFRTDERHGDATVDLGTSRSLVLERRGGGGGPPPAGAGAPARRAGAPPPAPPRHQAGPPRR